VRRRHDPGQNPDAAFDAALRRLRRPEPDPSLAARCLPEELRAERRRPFRILAVDDEPAIRRLIQVHLERAGYEVLLAGDGPEALTQVSARRPDLIILDVIKPGPDGFQVLEALKEDPRTGEIPVIMLTARGDDDTMRHGLREGADLYMAKPFDPQALRAVVDRFLAVLGTPENPPPVRRWLK
jgi:CheY-like chemotaxis protein